MSEILWCDPSKIIWKITPVRDLHGVRGGNWDIDRRHLFSECAKSFAIRERYVEGKPWLGTVLFTDVYPRRLERDGRVGRWFTITDLASDYERRYDGLFKRLERDGFRIDNGRGRNYPLPALLLGRDGEVFIGNQGNHRLAMAQVLGLEKIAGRVICRHLML